MRPDKRERSDTTGCGCRNTARKRLRGKNRLGTAAVARDWVQRYTGPDWIRHTVRTERLQRAIALSDHKGWTLRASVREREKRIISWMNSHTRGDGRASLS